MSGEVLMNRRMPIQCIQREVVPHRRVAFDSAVFNENAADQHTVMPCNRARQIDPSAQPTSVSTRFEDGG